MTHSILRQEGLGARLPTRLERRRRNDQAASLFLAHAAGRVEQEEGRSRMIFYEEPVWRMLSIAALGYADTQTIVDRLISLSLNGGS